LVATSGPDPELTPKRNTSHNAAQMTTRTKRTYNLSETAIRRVRELADQYEAFHTQDRVVEAAVERLYLELRARAEEAQWEAAAADPQFRAEAGTIAEIMGDRDSWPA